MTKKEFLERLAALEKKGGEFTTLMDDVRATLSKRKTGYTEGGMTPSEEILLTKSADPEVLKAQEQNDDLYLLSKVMGVSPKATQLYRKYMGGELGKAMAAATAGSGAEWVPTGFSNKLIDLVRLQLKVAALFTEIPQPTNPYKVPVVASDATAYLIAESTSDTADKITASTPGTTDLTLTAKKLAARVLFSEEVSEDSIIPVLPFVKTNVARALGDGLETAIINGDTNATHMDSDVTNAKDVRKAYEGLRYLALNISGVQVDCSTFNLTNVRAIRKAMGKYGVDPSKLAWIAGPKVWNKMLGLDEVTTVEKYGPKATILTGELGKLDGISIIVSEHAREDLNNAGVYDGTTTTDAVLLLVNRDSFMLGDRRKITTKTQEDIETDQMILVSTQRKSFKRVYATTQPFVACGYNITA